MNGILPSTIEYTQNQFIAFYQATVVARERENLLGYTSVCVTKVSIYSTENFSHLDTPIIDSNSY